MSVATGTRRAAAWLVGLPWPKRADWIFAVRASIAGIVALSIAYALDLENPQWAMMTVFIVAQPVAGMAIAKGFYRLTGTMAGALAALAIDFLAGQNAVIFLAAMALWIGASTLLASLLRNPEAYGAALAGYTAVIIGLPSFSHGHLVVELAIARSAEIMLGIACAGLASRLILPQLAGDQIVERIRNGIRDIADYAEGAFSSADRARLVGLSRKLIREIQALAEMRAYVRLESPSRTGRSRSVRRTIGSMLSSISAARMLRNHPPPPGVPPTAARLALRDITSEIRHAPAAAFDAMEPWIKRLNVIAAEARQAPSALDFGDPDRIGTAARLAMAAEFAEALAGTLTGLDALRNPGSRRAASERAQPDLLVHRDYGAATKNAIRAIVATTLVAVFWLQTQWADAAGVTVIVAVVSILFASRPSPIESALGFFRGTLLAVPFAFLAGQILLPRLHGFWWFVAVVVPLLVPAGLAMANARWVGTATAFAVNFLAFLNPRQTMVYAPQAFFNTTISVLAGILLAIIVFALVLPSRPADAAARIVAAIREDMVRLCLHERAPRRSTFESLAYDRISQLMPFAQRLGGEGEALLRGSVAGVTVGLEILSLRAAARLAVVPVVVSDAVADFLRKLARLFRRPVGGQAAADFIAAARKLAEDVGRERPATEMLRIAASLRVIAAAIEDHPAFFQK